MADNEIEKAEESLQVEEEYPSRKVVLPAMAALYLAVFLVAIDRTILGTAIPAIADEFKSFGDIAWYQAAFLLPLCTLQLSFGRVYIYYSTKWVLVALIVVFEIGSIVCATAPSSNALIGGRVITGIGAAGTTSGALILINALVPLRSRPKYTGGLGAMFGLSSVLGPLLGGYLTAVTWRWCFWISVPIGAISIVLLAFLCPKRTPPIKPAPSLLGKIKQLDPLGFALIAPAVTCLLFALEFGGTRYSWNDGRIIALFIVFGLCGIAFIGTQIWRKDEATVPPKIFLQRSILSGCIASLGIGAIIVIYPTYLPVWFQAIQDKSSQSSGLSLLPFLLGIVILVMIGGFLSSTLGYYTPLMIIGAAITIVGAGLVTTWEVDSGQGQWIGYQALTGIGFGLVLQQPNIAAQTVLPKDEVSIGVTLLTFFQFLGGSVFITACQLLLERNLATGLEEVIPNLDTSMISNGGATTLRNLVPAAKVPIVLEVYNSSLRSIWYLGLGLACLVFLSSFGLEWKSVKKDENQKN